MAVKPAYLLELATAICAPVAIQPEVDRLVVTMHCVGVPVGELAHRAFVVTFACQGNNIKLRGFA